LKTIDKETMDYTNWIWADSFKQIGSGLLIYVVLLGAYWTLVG